MSCRVLCAAMFLALLVVEHGSAAATLPYVGSSRVVLAETANQNVQLLGVFPKAPFVLKGATANAFVAFADGSQFICANGKSADLWDLTTGQRVFSMKHRAMIIGLAVAPDEKTLLTVAAGRGSPAQLWSLNDGTLLHEYPSAFRDGISPVPREQDAFWRFPRISYSPETGFGFTSVAFSPTGDAFVTGCENGDVILWDAETGNSTARMRGTKQRLWSVLFSPDRRRILASGADGTVQLWDPEAKRLVKEYLGHKGQMVGTGDVRAPLAFSTSGQRFVFSDWKPRGPGPGIRVFVRLCDAHSGEVVRELPEAIVRNQAAFSECFDACVAFLPRRRILANVGSMLQIWDINIGAVTHRHFCSSGVGTYARPNVEYVKYLPAIDAAMAVEVENDENTLHQDWITISVVPLRRFEEVGENGTNHELSAQSQTSLDEAR